MKATIRIKLLAGFGVVLLLMVGMGVMSSMMTESVDEANRQAIENMEQIIFTVEKETDHLEWLNQLANSFLTGEKFTGELDHTGCDFGRWYYGILNSDYFNQLTPEFREVFLAIEEPHEHLHRSAHQIVDIMERTDLTYEEKEAMALEVYHNETQMHMNQVRVSLDQLQQFMAVEKDAYVSQAEQQANTAKTTIFLVTIIAIIIGITAAIIISSRINKPIKEVAHFLEEMAESGGDLTRRIEVKTKDEVGELSQSFNAFIGKLHDIVAEVKVSSQNVSEGSKELTAGNQDLSQRTEEQASSLEEISSTVEEVAASITSSSQHATEADNFSQDTLKSIEKGGKVVGDMQDAMEDITTSSKQIGEIISKVNDIAFQTNLLALNAAVEAARAGEQGKGFAVVAAEVRTLAGRASEAAKEIEDLIKESLNRVERGNDLMNDTENVLKNIMENTRKATDIIGEIAASLREQTVSASDIRTTIEELNQVTQQNAAMVEEVASASDNMSQEAIMLSGLVDVFNVESDGKQKHYSEDETQNVVNKNNNKDNVDFEEFEKF
ncbi:methyl-accepting chemotaxis protein [Desulfitispora alkaliphila]|uniref:methyl-accepting chemotaxis protein n=1 Tax=Desulfitispora alkaliphila TaxID=622674 RepID=UPI003D1F8029